tara:strand:+ start:128 stop:823 length:696 start_codon:yes stop_codon:yes gene_type:complete
VISEAAPVLAMEVSQRNGGVALRCLDGSVVVHRLTSTARGGDALMPAIEELMQKADVAPAQLTGIGVSIGPGGFTGLRIGIAAAKMLSWSLGIPLVAVPSALLAASADREAGTPMAVAVSGKGETCWLSLVEGEPGDRRLMSGDAGGQLVDSTGFRSMIQHAACLLADEHLPESMADHGLPTRTPDFDPSALLILTEKHLARGEVVDPLNLTPLYPRLPEAVLLWDARESG